MTNEADMTIDAFKISIDKSFNPHQYDTDGQKKPALRDNPAIALEPRISTSDNMPPKLKLSFDKEDAVRPSASQLSAAQLNLLRPQPAESRTPGVEVAPNIVSAGLTLTGLHPQQQANLANLAHGTRAGVIAAAKESEPPAPVTGTVARNSDGSIGASNPMLQSAVDYVRGKCGPEAFAGLAQGANVQLTMSAPDNIVTLHKLVQSACSVDKIGANLVMKEPGADAEVEANVTLALLRRVMTEGPAAIGKNAAVGGGGTMLEALRRAGTPTFTGDAALSKSINDALAASAEEHGGDEAAALGAAWLYGMERRKQLDSVGAAAWLMSLGGSGGIGAAAEYGAIKPAENKLFGAGFKPQDLTAGQKLLSGALHAAGALPPEAFDSVVISKFINHLEGESMVPALADAKQGLTAGAIAAAAAYPAALVEAFKEAMPPAVKAVASLLTTEIATFGAGAIVPIELAKARVNTKAAILQAIADGRMAPVPQGQDPEAFIDQLTAKCLDDSVGTETAKKSLAIAAGVGTLPWMAEMAGASPEVLDILSRTLLNPVEISSLNVTIGLAQWAGGKDGFITTDARKSEQLAHMAMGSMAQAVRGKAKDAAPHEVVIDVEPENPDTIEPAPLQAPAQTPSQATGSAPAILRTEHIDKVMHPRAELLAPIGGAINTALSGVATAASYLAFPLTRAAELAGLKSAEKPLEQRLDFTAAAHPADVAEAASGAPEKLV